MYHEDICAVSDRLPRIYIQFERREGISHRSSNRIQSRMSFHKCPQTTYPLFFSSLHIYIM
jgi:hypothetical protein